MRAGHDVGARRSTFTRSQVKEIRQLLRKLRVAERSEQKTIRAKLRRIGFHISDYDTTGAGFTVSDFDGLLQRGVVSGIDDGEVDAGKPDPNTAPTTRSTAPKLESAENDPPSHLRASAVPADTALAGVLAALSAPRHSLARGGPLLPDRGGLYAIYGSAEVWQLLSLGDPPDDRPLYVGKAEDSLVTRDLRTHFGEQRLGRQSLTGRSTVRRSLAALLPDELGLDARPRNPRKPGRYANYGLSLEGDRALTAWMRSNLTLAAWIGDRRRLAEVESKILQHWKPPLNLAGVTTPWSKQVSAARAAKAAEAKRAAQD
jgi:hypothetical protein